MIRQPPSDPSRDKLLASLASAGASLAGTYSSTMAQAVAAEVGPTVDLGTGTFVGRDNFVVSGRGAAPVSVVLMQDRCVVVPPTAPALAAATPTSSSSPSPALEPVHVLTEGMDVVVSGTQLLLTGRDNTGSARLLVLECGQGTVDLWADLARACVDGVVDPLVPLQVASAARQRLFSSSVGKSYFGILVAQVDWLADQLPAEVYDLVSRPVKATQEMWARVVLAGLRGGIVIHGELHKRDTRIPLHRSNTCYVAVRCVMPGVDKVDGGALVEWENEAAFKSGRAPTAQYPLAEVSEVRYKGGGKFDLMTDARYKYLVRKDILSCCLNGSWSL